MTAVGSLGRWALLVAPRWRAARSLEWIAIALALQSLLPAHGAALERPVGLDVRIQNGVGSPLVVVPDHRYFIAALDFTARIEGATDRDVAGVLEGSFLRSLDWSGLGLFREEWIPDGGAWRRVRIHIGAAWMAARHTMTVVAVDSLGVPLGPPVLLDAGSGRERSPHDSFAIRRVSAIQTALGCPGEGSCAGAVFREEVLFQLRNASALRSPTFFLDRRAVALRVDWTTLDGGTFDIPLRFEPHPVRDYGLEIRVHPLASADVSPGDSLSFRLEFTDGSGTALHPPGALPSYRDFLEGRSFGLRYFSFDQGVLFFDDKNREGVLLTAFGGPIEHVRQNRSEVPFEAFLDRTAVVALPARDGYFCEWQLLPPGDLLFGGALVDSTLWDVPVSDTLTFHLPEDAEPGTYLFVVKARREFLGESVLAAAELEVKVGTTAPVSTPWVGGCESCHVRELGFDRILHANDDVRSCALCHAPLSFEPDNLLNYRVHYVHHHSSRYTEPKDECRRCHVNPESVRRPSYLACLSCHLSYHGAVEDAGLYDQCADVRWCHPDHNLPTAGLPSSGEREGAPVSLAPTRTAPGRTFVSIPYGLRRPGRVRIEVFDVLGRRVCRLGEEEPRSAGVHVAHWDGRTQGGALAPNGVYYARIETEDGTTQARVLLAR